MIDSYLIAIFCTVSLYGLATLWQARLLLLGQGQGQGQGLTLPEDSALTGDRALTGTRTIQYLGGGAWFIHALILISTIYAQSPSHALTVTQVVNLISLSVTGLVLLAASQKPLANLFIFIFPLNAFSLLLLQFLPGMPLTLLPYSYRELIHIGLSIVSFSVLFAAALQAILLAIGEYCLRTKRVTQRFVGLPPLQTMENLLFQLILIGFVLLSLVLITSMLSFAEFTSGTLLEKTLLALCAWSVFLFLLLGRFFNGWRGRTAIKGTLLGMFILMLSYFGTKLLLIV